MLNIAKEPHHECGKIMYTLIFIMQLLLVLHFYHLIAISCENPLGIQLSIAHSIFG